jgi:hypothetical protein
MATTYTYSNSVDFPNGLIAGQLFGEIEADSGITKILINVLDVAGDDVEISFETALTAPEVTTLDGIVAAHDPAIAEIITSVGYVELSSSLADNRAVRITAIDAAGGIDIDAGIGGIAIDTTNAISIDGGAACNFTTTAGNLELRATAALVNIDGGSGINIGSLAEAQPINIGTPAAARTITVGNQTTTTQTAVQAGTGGFTVDVASGGGISLDSTGAACNWSLASTGDAQDLTIAVTGSTDSSLILDSAGTGTDSIRMNTTGGIDVDATGVINIATGSNVGGAITLDAAFNNGGITISSGTQGIGINSNGGLIGIGHSNGGNIDIGTAAVARTITLGNTTGVTAVAINSGTGGITIGNNANGGEIHVGNVANAKTLIVGNNTGATRLFTRWGTGGNVAFQGAETALANASATLTMTQLLTQILTIVPTVTRTLTLPTAADAVSGISGVQVNDCIEFTIIHDNVIAGDPLITIAMGTGGTAVGFMNVHPRSSFSTSYFTSGSGTFRLRFTNVTVSSEAYTVYRVS